MGSCSVLTSGYSIPPSYWKGAALETSVFSGPVRKESGAACLQFNRLRFLHEGFGCASNGLPGRVATLHVLRVEARLAQYYRGLAADMEAVHAEHHYRVGLRELAGPFLHEVRGAPSLP